MGKSFLIEQYVLTAFIGCYTRGPGQSCLSFQDQTNAQSWQTPVHPYGTNRCGPQPGVLFLLALMFLYLGIAAINIGGKTLHSWSGIGLGDGCIGELISKVLISDRNVKNWMLCDTWIIDEISMVRRFVSSGCPGDILTHGAFCQVEAELFDKLNMIGQAVRGNSRPFGGIQMVLCGDFFQLPPVPSKPKCIRCGLESLKVSYKPDEHSEPSKQELDEDEKLFAARGLARSTCDRDIMTNAKGCGTKVWKMKFAFETRTWTDCDFLNMELTKASETLFRQTQAPTDA